MRKKQSFLPVPPLSLRALEDVENIEELARLSLHRCYDSGYYNAEKALRILRTCVIEALDIQIAYYEALSNYRLEWIREIREKTIETIVGLVGMPGANNRDFFLYEIRSTVKEHLAAKARTAKEKAALPQGRDRVLLRDSYLASFPGVIILDICWAAGQHYSEWKRWLRKAVKDGSAPDRAFRAILTSGKVPRENRKQPRPRGWK